MSAGWLLLAAYTCSGAAGLVYEVAWTRLLTLYMGHTIAAVSTVTAAFMGGLGLGSLAGGRLANRLTPRQALFAYATLEVVILIAALAMPSLLAAFAPVLGWTYRDGRATVLFPLVRLAGCLALLLIPSVALGASFPIAVRRFVHAPIHVGGAAGRLYAANTAGAALGSLAAGFLLIPTMGLWGTTLAGVAASALSIAFAMTLIRRDSRDSVSASAPLAPASPRDLKVRASSRRARIANNRPQRDRETGKPRYGLAAVVLALTGFATLVYEITWTRVFSMTLGPSTYAFAATLTSFIVGLAAGSFAGAMVAQRTRRPAFALAVALGATAIVACGASSLAGGPLLHYVIEKLAAPTQSSGDVLLRLVTVVMALVTPTAFGLGLAFPLSLELAVEGDRTPAQLLGTVYAVNTLASVAGALTAGFAVIPLVGLQRTLLIATLGLVLGAALVIARGMSSLRDRLTAIVLAAGACAWLIVSPQWDRQLLASGAYMYTRIIPKDLELETALKAGTLLYYREGATATVSVKRLAGDLSLAIDGKVDASTSGDMLTQKALAHLPLLLHPSPRDVAIIGLGSGVTLASALVHPVTSVDVIEISPEVIEASHQFSAVNHSALDDPRTRLILADGRSHLSFSTRQYDVIVSEPSNPWMAGVAALFTREFFQTARSRLAPNGIFCQWAHTYAISEEDLRSVVATFVSVFSNGTMWLIGGGDLLLIGSAGATELALDTIETAWQRPGVAADLREVSVAAPFSLLSLYIGGPDELRQYANSAPVQTDDKMALEFSGPVALYGDGLRNNTPTVLQLVSASRRPPAIARAFARAGAEEWRGRAAMLMKADASTMAYQDYIIALNLSPTDAGALGEFVPVAVAAHREAEAVTHLKTWLSAKPQTAALWIALSKLLVISGSPDEAVDAATRACQLEPADPGAFEQLASLYADLNDGARLEPVVGALHRLFPERAGTSYYAASLEFLRGRLPAALELATKAIQLDPRRASAHNLLGAIHANLGQVEQARVEFETARGLDPRDSVVYINLALLEMSSGHNAAAAGLFSEALTLDPASSSARQGLARATAIGT